MPWEVLTEMFIIVIACGKAVSYSRDLKTVRIWKSGSQSEEEKNTSGEEQEEEKTWDSNMSEHQAPNQCEAPESLYLGTRTMRSLAARVGLLQNDILLDVYI